jgi:mannose-6-phosphate isomerase-like protein (cupin superfamily)
MTAIAPIINANPTGDEMEARVARFVRLRPIDAYVDTALPGCERTTFAVLGRGPQAALEAEDVHLNPVRCAPGRCAPLHGDLTREVFIPLFRTWEVFRGPEGARSLRLGPWDTVAIPPGLSRGFRNVGDEDAWLIGIAGGRDPGRIDWPESVPAVARAAGVELPCG